DSQPFCCACSGGSHVDFLLVFWCAGRLRGARRCVRRGVVCGAVGACLAGRSWCCGAVLPAARIVWPRPGGTACVLREAPLRAPGCRVMGWWFRCPAPTAVEGAGLSVRLSPLWGGAANGSGGVAFIGGGRRIRTCSFSVMSAVCFRYTSPRCARVGALVNRRG